MHNLLHEPALTEVIRTPNINIIRCKVQVSLGPCVSAAALVLNYGVTNMSPTQRQTPPFVEEETPFPNT
jgi:hypothetical protein